MQSICILLFCPREIFDLGALSGASDPGRPAVYLRKLFGSTDRKVPERDLGSRKRRPLVKAAGSPNLLVWVVFFLFTNHEHSSLQNPVPFRAPLSCLTLLPRLVRTPHVHSNLVSVAYPP